MLRIDGGDVTEEEARAALIERFNSMRDSGVCSPTTRGLLDDAEALLASRVSTPPSEPRCNCGWGGTHDPDNPRCDAYEPPATPPTDEDEREGRG